MTPTYSIAPVSHTSVPGEIMWYSRQLKIENVCNDNDFFAILRSSDLEQSISAPWEEDGDLQRRVKWVGRGGNLTTLSDIF
jgi:hypothetical protein